MSATMRARGLKPVAVLAASRDHGDRLRYLAGCRCDACRRANTDYENVRAKARKAGDWNGFVPALKSRAHILRLSELGVGRKQVADASGVAVSIIGGVSTGARPTVRALTERRILAVTQEAAADRALIDAAPTWKLIDELLEQGFTKAKLAKLLGYEMPTIQINRTVCTVRNAHDVQQLHARIHRMPAAATQALIAELREEGYSPLKIQRLVNELVGSDPSPPADITAIHNGWIAASTADLVRRLHASLLLEETA